MKIATLVLTALLAAPAPALLAQQDKDDRTGVYKVKWRRAEEIVRLVRSVVLESSAIQQDSQLGVVILRGPEEDHVVLRELLEHYDVPPKNLEFQFYLIEARPGEARLKDGVPEEVSDVIAEVGALTRYSNFELIGSPVLRTIEGNQASIHGSGSVAYEVGLQQTSVIEDVEPREIRVGECQIEVRFGTEAETDSGKKSSHTSGAGVFSGFALPDGGLVVLGASGMGRSGSGNSEDVAIITVVKARVVSGSFE